MNLQIYDSNGKEFKDGDFFILDATFIDMRLCQIGFNPSIASFEAKIFDGLNNKISWEREPLSDYISYENSLDAYLIKGSRIINSKDITFFQTEIFSGKKIMAWTIKKRITDFYEAIKWIREKPEIRSMNLLDEKGNILNSFFMRKIHHIDYRYLSYRLNGEIHTVDFNEAVLDGQYELIEKKEDES